MLDFREQFKTNASRCRAGSVSALCWISFQYRRLIGDCCRGNRRLLLRLRSSGWSPWDGQDLGSPGASSVPSVLALAGIWCQIQPLLLHRKSEASVPRPESPRSGGSDWMAAFQLLVVPCGLTVMSQVDDEDYGERRDYRPLPPSRKPDPRWRPCGGADGPSFCSLSLLLGKVGEPVHSSAHGGSRTTSPAAALPRLRPNLNPQTVRAPKHQLARRR